MARAKNLIEGTDDPDSPESFGISQHIDSPVARIAATNGFKRSNRNSNEERWVKKLSNGKEAWLTTTARRDFETPMDLQTGHGGREWEFLMLTKTGKVYSEVKQLARAREIPMSYLLGAILQRLATWPENLPKPTLEAGPPHVPLPDPDDAELNIKNFVPDTAGKMNALNLDIWSDDIGYPYVFRHIEGEAPEILYTAQQLGAAGVEECRNWITQQWPHKPTVSEALPVPDPDDPTTVVQQFVASKTPYLPEYTKLARLLTEHPEVYVQGRVDRTSHHHYVHENTTNFSMELLDMPPEIDTEETGKLVNSVEALIQEECVKINKKIYKALERQYEWLTSDDAIDETIAANEWTFDENGKIGEGELTFNQLADRAKETARNDYRTDGLDYQWWDCTYEEWTAELKDMGFDGINIAFTGFWSQGDGASFTATSFDFMKWANWHMSSKSTERGHPYTDDLFLKEDVDDPPAKEHLHCMGRPTECQEYCPHCGAYCTLLHYDLNGTQMPQYHICKDCDLKSAEVSMEATVQCSLALSLTEADDPEIARIRKRVSKTKRKREAAELTASPEIQALDDPTAFIKQEVERRSEPIKKLEIRGRRWYRRGAGGVYCKAYIYINDKLVHVTPEQYGYNDHYLTLAKDWLMRNGYLVGLLDDERDPIWYLRDKHGIDLQYGVVDVARERDL